MTTKKVKVMDSYPVGVERWMVFCINDDDYGSTVIRDIPSEEDALDEIKLWSEYDRYQITSYIAYDVELKATVLRNPTPKAAPRKR